MSARPPLERAVAEDVGARAAAIVGHDEIITDNARLDEQRIDGVRPALAARPADAGQIAALLTAAAETGAAVIPRGGGGHQHLGNPPARADLVIDTTRLAGITDYTPADYVVAVRAGTRFEELQRALRANGQWLPLDPPGAGAATIGGLVAANRNGPRRLLWGSIRDLVIGIRVALPTGEVIKAGGKVVKNVAGYDLAKLFIGSFGACGIITEVTFKVLPHPGDGVTVLVTVPTAEAAHALTTAVMRSYLLPSALEAVSPAALSILARAGGAVVPDRARWAVLLLAEGLEESRERHVAEMRALAASAGGPDARVEVLAGTEHDALWRAVSEFPSPGAHPGGVVWRAGTRITRWLDVARAAGAAEPQSGRAVLAHAGVGLTYVAADPGEAPALGVVLERAANAGPPEQPDGYAVVEVAPPELKPHLSIWGAAPPAAELMRRLRAQYDPRGIMVPGRLGWGLS